MQFLYIGIIHMYQFEGCGFLVKKPNSCWKANRPSPNALQDPTAGDS